MVFGGSHGEIIATTGVQDWRYIGSFEGRHWVGKEESRGYNPGSSLFEKIQRSTQELGQCHLKLYHAWPSCYA